MNCEEFQRHIDLHLDQALAAAGDAAFENHARECPSCSAALHQARLLLQALREMPEQACPTRVMQRVFEKTGMSSTTPATRSFAQVLQEFGHARSLRPAMAGWALMMLLLISSYYLAGRIDRIEPPAYTTAELQQKKAQIDHAFGIFFGTVKKGERIARQKVFQSKFLRPVKAGLRHVFAPSSQEGEL